MSDPQKINVVVSGAATTQVVSPGSSTINLNQSESAVSVNQSSSSSSVSSSPQTNVNVGFLGVQGIPGASTTSPVGSLDGQVLYNRNGYISGARGFYYDPQNTVVKISGGNLILDNSNLVLSGIPTSTDALLVKDGTKNLLRVDTSSKRISLAENTLNTEYYVGIGEPNPQERLHVANGNFRIDGNMLVSGNIVPMLSGQFSLGSPTLPFKDLYLEGDSIVFVDKDAKITASSSGFQFQVTNPQGGRETLLDLSTTGTHLGLFKGDGSQVTGVPYSGLVNAGVFIEKDVPHNSNDITIDFFDETNRTLSYDPRVICQLSPPAGNNGFYFTYVQNVTRSSCKAVFSDKVTGNGYKVNCHISPINSMF